eukprot:Amastigsp_a388_12.p4 type:complete len:153 gc:universal Amastigsp_a388_12:834-1292(+)
MSMRCRGRRLSAAAAIRARSRTSRRSRCRRTRSSRTSPRRSSSSSSGRRSVRRASLLRSGRCGSQSRTTRLVRRQGTPCAQRLTRFFGTRGKCLLARPCRPKSSRSARDSQRAAAGGSSTGSWSASRIDLLSSRLPSSSPSSPSLSRCAHRL